MATTKVQTFPGDVEVTSNLAVNTNTLYVDATNERVGINTVTPVSNLHVVGEVSISDNLTVGAYSNLIVDVSVPRVRFDSTLNAYRLEIKPDTDITGIVGKARFGYIDNDADHASWGHIDNTGTNQWGFMVTPDNTSIINTRNRHEIRQNGSIKHTVSGTDLSSARVGINTDANGSYAMHVNGLVRQNLPTGHAYFTISNTRSNTGERIHWDSGVIPSDSRNNVISFDGTNDGWTVPIAGVYEVFGTITTYQQSSSARGYTLTLEVNEANYEPNNIHDTYSLNGSTYRNTNTYAKHNFTFMLTLAANDRVNVYADSAGVTGIFYYTNMSVQLLNPS